MKDMLRMPGGVFLMGSEEFYEEELPVREVTVARSGSTSIPSPWPSSAGS